MKNKVRSESNWRNYTTSKKSLSPKIKKLPENYIFEVICIATTSTRLNIEEGAQILAHIADPLCINENFKINLMCKPTKGEVIYIK